MLKIQFNIQREPSPIHPAQDVCFMELQETRELTVSVIDIIQIPPDSNSNRIEESEITIDEKTEHQDDDLSEAIVAETTNNEGDCMIIQVPEDAVGPDKDLNNKEEIEDLITIVNDMEYLVSFDLD